MKSLLYSLLIAACMMAIGLSSIQAETPTEAVDRVWNGYGDLKSDKELFPKKFCALSRSVAIEQGIAVIAPIMIRSKKWTSEECLIFVPLVLCLPKDKVVPLLKHYQSTGTQSEKDAANDFLCEIDSADWKVLKEQYLTP